MRHTQSTVGAAQQRARDAPARDSGAIMREAAGTRGSQEEPDSALRTLVCADPASQALMKLLARIAPSDVPVMISGDAGTGKGVVARHIHAVSGRSGRFVCVNCSAIAHQLADSGDPVIEVPVGPTGTVRCERWFEAARHGTLFLDEIAALPVSLQSQLLRVLQEQEAARAGLRDPGPTDVRLVAATTVDVGAAVAAGHFRLELFYRLNVGQVKLLPLRQRRGDVVALAGHFLRTYAGSLHLSPPSLSQEMLAALTQYSWPGNIRELENVIRFALLVSPEQELRIEDLKLAGAPGIGHFAPPTAVAPQMAPAVTEAPSLREWLVPMFETPGRRLLSDLENQIVGEAFRFTGRNQVRTAALLGVSRNVLRTLLRKHGMLVVRRRKGRGSGG